MHCWWEVKLVLIEKQWTSILRSYVWIARRVSDYLGLMFRTFSYIVERSEEQSGDLQAYQSDLGAGEGGWVDCLQGNHAAHDLKVSIGLWNAGPAWLTWSLSMAGRWRKGCRWRLPRV